MKITARDAAFLFIGMLLGISLSFLWFNITTMNIINHILPHINIESVNFDLNESALVEALNKTVGFQK